MLSRALRRWVEGKIEAVCRQVVLRGRASTGLYSCEDHEVDSTEPESTIAVRRAGRYGFVSECPPGALVAVVKVGKGNYIGVAETVPGEPEIEDGEVLIWATHGQRLKFTQDGDVIVTPKTGRKVLLGSDADGDCDPVVTTSQLNLILRRIRAHQHPNVGATAGDFSALSPDPELTLVVTGSPVVEATKP